MPQSKILLCLEYFDNIELSFYQLYKKASEFHIKQILCWLFNLRVWKEIADHIDLWKGGAEKFLSSLVGNAICTKDDLAESFSV